LRLRRSAEWMKYYGAEAQAVSKDQLLATPFVVEKRA
jgi:hypothetical protein